MTFKNDQSISNVFWKLCATDKTKNQLLIQIEVSVFFIKSCEIFSPYSFNASSGYENDRVPIGAITLFATASPRYQVYSYF